MSQRPVDTTGRHRQPALDSGSRWCRRLSGYSHADRAADLIRGGGPYACARIGLASRLPAMPDEGRREGSLVKSAAAWTTSSGSAAPWFCLSRQPTGVRGQPGGSGAGARLSRPSRRRERPLGAALNPYRKFSQSRTAPLWRYGLALWIVPRMRTRASCPRGRSSAQCEKPAARFRASLRASATTTYGTTSPACSVGPAASSRSTSRTRAGSGAAAPRRFPSSACSRSRSRSGPR